MIRNKVKFSGCVCVCLLALDWSASPAAGGSCEINSVPSLCKILTQPARLCNAATGVARVTQSPCVGVYVQTAKVLNDISKETRDGRRAKCVSCSVLRVQGAHIPWLGAESLLSVRSGLARPLGTTKLYVQDVHAAHGSVRVSVEPF